MKEFRRIYRTMSIDEILKYKIGTCIEQVNLMHYLLDKINVKIRCIVVEFLNQMTMVI